MHTKKEKLFLISKIPYKDSDLIVNLLSEENGSLTSRIYRGQKPGKESSFLYQPGDLIEVEYSQKQNDDFIKVQNTAHLNLIKADQFSYDRFVFHSFMLEVLLRIVHPGETAREAFEMLNENLKVDWSPDHKWKFVLWCLWKITRQGGYIIDIHRCAKCGNPTWRTDRTFSPQFRKENYHLKSASGSLICVSCDKNGSKKKFLTPAEVKVLWLFEQFPEYNSLEQLIPIQVLVRGCEFVLEYIVEAFEINLKSYPLFLSTLKSLTAPLESLE